MDVLWISSGLLGTLLCGIVTLLVMRGKISATTTIFPCINIICSCLIMLSLLGQYSVTLLAIELFWFGMSTYAFICAIGDKK